MEYLIGFWMGAAIPISIISAIIGGILLGLKVSKFWGGMAMGTIPAWLISATLSAYGAADGGPPQWEQGLTLYFVPAAVVGGIALFLSKRRRDS